mgnify:CR=1 FL=1
MGDNKVDQSKSEESKTEHHGLNIGDWWQQHISQPIHNWNDDRKIRRGIKKQGRCWGANCYEDDLSQSKNGGLTKSVSQKSTGSWLNQYK